MNAVLHFQMSAGDH